MSRVGRSQQVVILALLAASLTMAASGCKRPKKDPVGLGPYRFGETTLADAEKVGRCLPLGDEPDVVQCLGMPDAGLGGQSVFYFSQTTKQLREIEVTLRGCDPPEVGRKLEGMIKPASEKLDDGRRMFWNLTTMFVSARLPYAGTRECLINFVALDDTARIAALKAER
jgi:hypothetical protein